MIGLYSANSQAGVSFTGLLDTYGGAAAAYSVRRLSSTYEGSLMEVRRSSDNTVQDIGYDSNGDLDTTSLLSFVGAEDGFVRTWYDQSGNGNDATQTTTSSQPQIVSSGNLILENSKPALSCNGTSHFMEINTALSYTNQDNNSVYAISKSTNTNTRERIVFGGIGVSTRFNLAYESTSNGITYTNSSGFSNGVFTSTSLRGSQFLLYGDKNGTTQEIYANGESLLSNTKGSDTTIDNLKLFSALGSQYLNGTAQEIILWNESYKSDILDIFNLSDEYFNFP